MTDVRSLLAELRRPRLLIRAARHGLADYRRERDLARIMAVPQAPAPERALPRLVSEEAMLEAMRQAGGTGYSLGRHVDVLIALLAEAALMRRDAAA